MKWIFPKNQLPKHLEWVLVFDEEKMLFDVNMMVMIYNADTQEFAGGKQVRHADEIVAWMPLPKPPVFN